MQWVGVDELVVIEVLGLVVFGAGYGGGEEMIVMVVDSITDTQFSKW